MVWIGKKKEKMDWKYVFKIDLLATASLGIFDVQLKQLLLTVYW